MSFTQTKTFNIDQTVALEANDYLTFKFVLKSSTTSNFTASLSEGNLDISSTAASTGYTSTNCNYFHSASISSSIVSGSTKTIVFSPGLSVFHDNNYQFAPSPLTGSQTSSLYTTYGDVDYPFAIKPFDIVLTYLSDNTYVESRVLSVNPPDNVDPLLRVKLDSPLSTLLRTDLARSGGGRYRYFLILSRKKDETSAYLTFKKREGKTSYGFVIPNDISPDVLAKIDVITKEVKQKLISEQSAIDNISGGTFG
jgi:hypothetical protein